MSKYPSTVPTELSRAKAVKLVHELNCISTSALPADDIIDALIRHWDEAYQENLDRVMFANLSSYEP